MALVATPGDASANSYLTVAEADAIADAQALGRSAKSWLEAPFDDRERALISATSEIDAYVASVGPAWSTTQPLLFPRLADANGATPYIAQNVRLATFYQALYDLHNADLISDADSRRARGLTSFSDDDGSGSLAEPQVLSVLARRFLWSLKGLGRATLRSVPLASSYSSSMPELLS